MKKVVTLLVLGAFICSAAPVFAQKGASERAMERASDKAIFHRVTDWFATIGKSEEEKQQIIAERDAERAAKRAEKEARKAEKKAKEKIREAEEEAEAAKEKAEKEAGKMKNKMKGMKGPKKGS